MKPQQFTDQQLAEFQAAHDWRTARPLPDGRVLGGADAVPELMRRIRGWGWLARLFALPPVRPVARQVYAWIARNRMKISCAAGPRES